MVSSRHGLDKHLAQQEVLEQAVCGPPTMPDQGAPEREIEDRGAETRIVKCSSSAVGGRFEGSRQEVRKRASASTPRLRRPGCW